MHRYPAILNLGFRLFFFTASAFAVLTMLAWLAVYQFQVTAFSGALPPSYWHGHEMVYGYAAAVVTGFLFTAVQNWTGLPLPHGWPLFCYWLPWFVARLLFAFAPGWQLVAACFDVLFALGHRAAGHAVFHGTRRWLSLHPEEQYPAGSPLFGVVHCLFRAENFYAVASGGIRLRLGDRAY